MTTAHETSTTFSDEVIREHVVFEIEQQHEMKEMLGRYADGQVEMLQRAMDDWDRVSFLQASAPILTQSRSSLCSNVSGSTCERSDRSAKRVQ